MATNRVLTEADDAALYVIKIFQDLLRSAADKVDVPTVKAMLLELPRFFKSFVESRHDEDIPLLELLIERADSEAEKQELSERIRVKRKKKKDADRITLAREQILFGVTARVLSRLLVQTEAPTRQALFVEMERHLPVTVQRLGEVLDSLNDREATDYWGWSWWDLPADGEAHFIDTHTAPNNLFCVRALHLMATISAEAVSRIHLPSGHSFAFLADPENGQGLVQALRAIQEQRERWSVVLEPKHFDKIENLLELLSRARDEERRNEESRIIAAELSATKLQDFKANLVSALNRFGRMRALFERLKLVYQAEDATNVPSWGYNQIDEKGAYIGDSGNVSYVGWGEEYGRGLGRTEDSRVFLDMIGAAGTKRLVGRGALVEEVSECLVKAKFKNPIMLHSLSSEMEFSEFRRRDAFTARHRPDCPPTEISDIDGFMGVLKIGSRILPVFDVTVSGEGLEGKVVVADLPRFARWDQYSAADKPGEEDYLIDRIYIRVTDLNKDNVLRQEILTKSPDWLAQKPDREKYLRSQVVVNVYEKFRLRILDSSAAWCFTIEPAKTEAPPSG